MRSTAAVIRASRRPELHVGDVHDKILGNKDIPEKEGKDGPRDENAVVVEEVQRNSPTSTPGPWLTRRMSTSFLTAAKQARRKHGVTHTASWLLYPESLVSRVFEQMIAVVLLYLLLVTPFDVALIPADLGVIFCLNRVVDAVFFLDILRNFWTAYLLKPAHRGALPAWETNLWKISRRYVMGGFFVDVVALGSSSFEIATVILQQTAADNDGSQSGIHRLRIMKVLRLVRLVRVLGVLERSKVLAHLADLLEIEFGVLEMLRGVLMMAVIAHWLACTWCLTGQLSELYLNQSWLMNLETSKNMQVDRSDPWQLYCLGVYWALMTITGIGYGDVSAQTWPEYIVSCICMLAGALTWTYTISVTLCAVTLLEEERNTFGQVHQDVSNMCRDFDLSKELRRRLHSYLRDLRRAHPRNLNTFSRATEMLSDALQTDIRRELFTDLLRRVRYFRSAEADLLLELQLAVSTSCFALGEWLVPDELTVKVTITNELDDLSKQRLAEGLARKGHQLAPFTSELEPTKKLAEMLTRGWLPPEHPPHLTILEHGVAVRNCRLRLGHWHEDMIMRTTNLIDFEVARAMSFCVVYTLSAATVFKAMQRCQCPRATGAIRWAACYFALSRLLPAAAKSAKASNSNVSLVQALPSGQHPDKSASGKKPSLEGNSRQGSRDMLDADVFTHLSEQLTLINQRLDSKDTILRSIDNRLQILQSIDTRLQAVQDALGQRSP